MKEGMYVRIHFFITIVTTAVIYINTYQQVSFTTDGLGRRGILFALFMKL